MDIKSYINDLFRYLDTFERNYEKFETEGFLQTYNGIYAVFEAMRHQRDKAVEVDRDFLSHLQKAPLTSSDLRQIAIQVLITFFESEADIDGQSNKSYLYCRDLRPTKRDISYFEEYLIPTLFRDGSLNNNFKLNHFFLREISRYLNKWGRPIDSGTSPEMFNAMTTPAKFLELMRRRMTLGKDLIVDRASLEFHLQRVDAFVKIGRQGGLYDQYLAHWGYLKKSTFWERIKGALGLLWGKFKGTFKSFRFFRLSITQRSGAYGLYIFFILFFLFWAIYIPVMWNDYKDNKLQHYQENSTQSNRGATGDN